MIRVNIELIPGGIGKPRHLGTIDIWNDVSGTYTRGNYSASLSRRGAPQSVWKVTDIKDFPRRSLGAYDLLYRVLRQVVGERNGDTEPLADSTTLEDAEA